jgi:hypothetical protein
MEVITINKKNYTLADNVITNAPIWCKGVRNGRELTKKKSLDENYFIYARYVDDEWIECEGKSVKYDKVLIRNIYLKKIDRYVKEITEDDDICDDKNVMKAPPIITLADSEKFCDDNGYMLEIETRGIREHDKIYFKVKDVAEQFENDSLQSTLIKNSTTYIKCIDYEYFICKKDDTVTKKTCKTKVKTSMFLTYEGILRVLFASRCGNANNFIKWATKTLFTSQLGTVVQKKKLASNLLGIPVNDFNSIMLKPNVKTSISSIYFITLGTTKDLHVSMDLDDSIPDDDIICIYGYTDNLRRRLMEHKNKYKNIKGANLAVKYYSFVDKSLLSKAEKDIKEYFISTHSHLEYDVEQEMVCVDSTMLKYLEAQYSLIGEKYKGDQTEIIQQMKDMEKSHKLELTLKDHEIQKKEYEMKIMSECHEKQMALKDVEVLKWKVKFLEKIEK